jgi:PmbA protein
MKALAEGVVALARSAGADEVAVVVSESTQVQLSRRDGRVEQASEASSRGISLSVMVDGRYSSHSSSDLRAEPLAAFVRSAIEASRLLEPDPDRALPDIAECGPAVPAAQIDALDPSWAERTAEGRSRDAESVEHAIAARGLPHLISAASYVGDGWSNTVRVTSNGFSEAVTDAWFTLGGEATVQDDERRPEAASYFGTRYRTDLPSVDQIADDLAARVHERIGAGPVASGSYPMLLLNRAAGRLLGVLGGALAGSSLHQRRSCLADHLGQPIGSAAFTLRDEPFLPRGLASRTWDGDGLTARPFTVVEAGVLRSYYINVYYGRKLGVPPTTGGRSNWVVPAGDRPWHALIASMPEVVLVDGFVGGNSNPATGDFSFGIRGALYRYGQRDKSLSEMNVSGNLLDIFHRLVAVADDPWPWGSAFCPSLLFDGVQFSGT